MKKKKRITVLVKEPGKTVEICEIENELQTFQELVGGYIETVTPFEDLTFICDEEGRLKGKPYNCKLFGINFVGTVVLAGVKGDEFADVPYAEDPLKIVSLFPALTDQAGGRQENVRRIPARSGRG